MRLSDREFDAMNTPWRRRLQRYGELPLLTHLGLDVHDPGPLPTTAGGPVLAPGMVLTVEPGLYFTPDLPDLPAGLAGIGVRIEDDLLVTESGSEILTGEVPRTVPELEALVGADTTRPRG